MRKSWTDQSLHAALIPICASLGKFPSNSDLLEIGRGDIANQITRRGGWKIWTKALGYERAWSGSDTGWQGEKLVMEQLLKQNFSVGIPEGVRSPYDLLIDTVLRIDVKTTSKITHDYVTGWFYRIGKHAQCDVLCFYQVDTGDSYFVPWYHCPTTNVTLSVGGGKYRPYLNNFELLRSMVAPRLSEKSQTNPTSL